jgi:hypothetical protein
MSGQPLLARFMKGPGEEGPLPALGEVLRCLMRPEDHPEAKHYLDRRPGLLAGAKLVVSHLAAASRDMIAKAAYYRYLERMRGGDSPFVNRQLEDWLEAEKALAGEGQARQSGRDAA